MRLINTQTLRLEDFTGRKEPPYAILSHTWEQEEVTLQDMEAAWKPLEEQTAKDRAIGGKAGFTKIVECARIAASEGFNYVWIDTCCIDKSSSAELSEAINSMYDWYKKSQVCYTYLADVPDCTVDDIDNSALIKRDPSDPIVRFYSKNWTFIGTKAHLLDHVQAATGIFYEVLTNGDSSTSSIARRMSWASQRVTTRVEDMAYCLLGIFDVNMPLLYGEGERAFIRLQEEITKKTNDQSIFAWRAPDLNAAQSSSSYRGLLARSPAEFDFSGTARLRNLDMATPFNITNQGYNITLPLSPLSSAASQELLNLSSAERTNEFLALLDCGGWKSKRAILLERISEEDTQYVRIQASKLLQLDDRIVATLPWQRQSIHIRQIPEVSPTHISKRIGAIIVSYLVHPLEDALEVWSLYDPWDPDKRMIRFPPQPNLRNGLIGELGFSSILIPFSVRFGLDPTHQTPVVQIVDRNGNTEAVTEMMKNPTWMPSWASTNPSLTDTSVGWMVTHLVKSNSQNMPVWVRIRMAVVDETLAAVLNITLGTADRKKLRANLPV